MRKISLLLGALGGAMAGYVFSNKNLRDELTNAKDAEAAGKILAKHLQRDGKQIGKEVKDFATSKEVQDNLKKAQAYVKKNAKKLRGELNDLVKDSTKSAKRMVTSKSKATKKTARRSAKGFKNSKV